jgi:hypothetical protein
MAVQQFNPLVGDINALRDVDPMQARLILVNRGKWMSTITSGFFNTKEEAEAADAKAVEQQKIAAQKQQSIDSLKQQILGQGTASKWSGEGFGSAEANARGMAEILSGIGITDIRQFGEIKQKSIDPESGQEIITTTYGNKTTGQAVPNTYSERQTGNAWGGTFAGSGNTGFRVQFAPDGTPYFYTTGASSNDLANLLGDNAILNFAANVAAATFGGPAGVAALQLAQGNDIEDAAKAATLAYAGGQIGGVIAPEISSGLQGAGVNETAANVAGKSITGGLLSEAQGGDFLTGAAMSGLSGAANEAKIAAAGDYLSSQETGPNAYNDAVSNAQAGYESMLAEAGLLPPVDTSFTPDYSLSSGAPVIPEMGAQGIQVPTINEVIDVANTPVDYSLPIPDSGLGLQVPSSGVSLGDPNSFINQPAPNVNVNIPEVVEKPMTQEELDKELAKIDLAKAAAGLAVPALLATGAAATSGGDQQTGYEIVPVPGSWKSPEYNKAFQESAPIDFGTRALLQGTQWENAPAPQSISSLINTLNNQYMPMNALPQVASNQVIGNIGETPVSIDDIIASIGRTGPQAYDMNKTIGQLNNAPASLASIISGIQSQYG